MIHSNLNPKDALERAKLLMKYDTKKTLTENVGSILEQSTPGQTSDIAHDIYKLMAGDVETEDIEGLQTLLKYRVFGKTFKDGSCLMSKVIEYYKSYSGSFSWSLGGFTSGDLIKDITKSEEKGEPEFEEIKQDLLKSINDELNTFCKNPNTAPGPAPAPAPGPAPAPAPGPAPAPAPGPAPRRRSRYTPCPETFPIAQFCKNNTIRKVQGCLGITADGAFGPLTQAALERKGLPGTQITQNSVDTACGGGNSTATYDAEEEITIGDETSSSGSAITAPLDAIPEHKINYMKNKLFVPKKEKLKILEQHNFLRNAIFAAKNIITEQKQIQGEELIKKAIQLGCRMVAGAAPFTNKDKTQRWYQKTANYDQTKGAFKTGDYLQFSLSIDSRNPDSWTVTVIPTTVDANGQRVPQRTSDGKIVRKGPFKWTCKALVDDLNKEVTYDVERFQEQQWQTKEEAMTNKSIDFTNPNSYTSTTVNGITLYRNLTSAQIGTSEIKPQAEILKYWRDKFGASDEFKENDDPEKKTWGFKKPYGLGWKEYQIPDTEKQFSENIRIFLSPTKYKTVTQGSSTEVGTVAGQLKVSEKDCRKNVETYYEAYLSDSEFTPDLELLKKNLNACHKRYCRPRENQGKCGKLGGLFGSQLDELLDFFKGMGDYKGQRIGRQERWHLEQK